MSIRQEENSVRLVPLRSWYRHWDDDRGAQLSSGSPHLLCSAFVAEWELTLYLSSIWGALAGGIVYFLVQAGPLDVPARRFNPRYLLHTIRTPAT